MGLDDEKYVFETMNIVDMVDANEFEKDGMPTQRQITHDLKIQGINKMKVWTAAETIERLPAKGETTRIISGGKFDFLVNRPGHGRHAERLRGILGIHLNHE